ncbi:MAG TPA: bifunctional phosphoribosyl-AMP cyclohydrolase/phosphoribosyl-ATP diphosphatase HisIE [Steroidobacteraceae bacterium]|nr:bifunctional phosphoribosyl-AMP cyclohydrolase/phosphoribosyl-ATP diphosphatase HisIE [Steroidobacteraceae bacterium]
MTPLVLDGLDFAKGGGLLPAIVQDATSGRVLMLGYMDRAALEETLDTGRVVFFSRSRGGRWLKGETTGHYLNVVQVSTDCDNDALLVLAHPVGPTCHLGTTSCFDGAQPSEAQSVAFLAELERIVASRIEAQPEGSYTARLFGQGTGRIAQKVGEEGVETALAGVSRDDPALVGEASDLIFHLLVLLRARGIPLARVVEELSSRHAARR